MFLRNIFQNKINVLAFLSLFSITCITFFKSAVELEDAEQAYYSQWMRWGYDDQPPLYTWVQYGINTILGVSKFSFSFLRGVIFSGVLLVLYQFGKKLTTYKTTAELSVLILILVPVFIDFTFRRLSHTALLCLAVLCSYWIVCKLIHEKTFGNYLIFGVIVSMGILSKYNYALFLVAFGLACFFDKKLRAIIFSKYIFWTVVLTVILISPHFYWLLGPEGFFDELKNSVQLKTENGQENGIFFISPSISLLITLLKLVAPLIVAMAVLFALKKIKISKPEWDWFCKLFWSQLAVLLVFFVVFDVQKIEERWLLPLLLPFVVLLIKCIQFKAVQKWINYCFALFLSLVFIQVVRTPIEKYFEIPSSVHYGFDPISNKLNKNYPDKMWILPNVTYGGNIKLLNPQKMVFSRDDFSLPASEMYNTTVVEVVLGKENLKESARLDSVIGFGKEKEKVYFIQTTGPKNRFPR